LNGLGDAAVSRRSVGQVVLTSLVDIPALPSRLLSDCEREICERIQLDAGDVEALSLARARTRWPGYSSYVQAVADCLQALGLPNILPDCEIALMACRGARYHHDAEQYGDVAFCNLFLSEDKGLDLHFPTAEKRIALQRGTVAIFDTAQAHAVIRHDHTEFHAEHFLPGQDCSVFFLTWELPMAKARVASTIGVRYTPHSTDGMQVNGQGVEQDGQLVRLCPTTGRWQAA
jgi:hypothetical protein